MKIFNLLFKHAGNRQGVRSFGFLLLSMVVLASCDKADINQVAEERFLLNDLQINASAELPLLVGKDSLLNFNSGPETSSNSELVWETSDPQIATVDELGRVKAVAVGEATIKVSSTDGGAKTSSILVQVIDRIEYATAIEVVPASVSIFEGEKSSLKATIAPANVTYKTLVWSSSNPAMAVVSPDGEVSGIAKGNATITVSTTDGSGVSKTIPVEIKEVIPVTAITINTVLDETIAVGQTTQLEFSFVPANASVQSMLWTSSDPAVVSVSETGLIRGLTAGNASITVESRANTDIKATININVEGGKLFDTFMNGLVPNWIAPTAGSSGIVENNRFKVLLSGTGANKRGDFRRSVGGVTGATVHAGTYPIIAFKFNRPLPTGGNIIFDTNLGRYQQHVGNGNNQLTILTAKDGVQVFYADMAGGSFSTAQTKLSTTAPTVFTTFQVVVADFPAAQLTSNTYEVHWIRSFKTVAELEAYINK